MPDLQAHVRGDQQSNEMRGAHYLSGHARDNELDNERYQVATKSHNMFVKIEVAGSAITSSTTEGYEEWAPLNNINGVLRFIRQTNPNVTQEKKASGRVLVYNTPLYIPNGHYTIDLIHALIDGADMTISIDRIGHFKGEIKKPLEQYIFTNCEGQESTDLGDSFYFSFRATKVTKKINTYDQEGSPQGTAEMTFDLKANKIE